MSRQFWHRLASSSSSPGRSACASNRRRRARLELLESRMLLDGDPIVTVQTNFGSFQIELYPTAAPPTVANFLTYVNDGTYTNTIFNRSVPGSVEQAGGYVSPTATFSGSTSQFTPIATNAPIPPSKYSIDNVPVLGTVATALDSGTNEATSEWFVNMDNNPQSLVPLNNGGSTVFGQVISGMSVLYAIESLPVKNVDNGTFSQLPLSTNNQLAVITSIAVDSIDGTVFTDLNNNGPFGSGDPTLAGRTVFVDRDGTGVPDANNPSTITNSSGNYTFTGLPVGSYTVEEVLPANTRLDTSMSKVTVAPDQTATDVDFGERPPIIGTVFQDANGNQQFDPGEPTVSDRTVFLNIDGSGAPDGNNPSATTNANGLYYFSNLATGTYTVEEVVAAGVTMSTSATRTVTVQIGPPPYVIVTALVNFGEVPPLTNNQKYVVQLYEDLLHRKPESAAEQFWSNLLSAGQTRPQIALEIEQSAEYRNGTVTGLFEYYLHRAPDAASLAADSSLLVAGSTAEGIAISLIASPEYFQNRGGSTNQGFLNALYSDVLHRPIDAASAKALASLNFGQENIRLAIVDFVFSSTEYLDDLASRAGAPAATSGYVEYGWYQAYLGRNAEAAVVSSAVAQLRSGTSQLVCVANLLGSAEFYSDVTAKSSN